MSQASLTLLSTGFILASGLSLCIGWYFIKRRHDIERHKLSMLSATGFAGLFLVAYISRWSLYGSKTFAGTGGWKTFYIANLIPHIILATALGPLALRLIYLALRKRDFAAHRRLARITFPIWLYVSASGWLIYYLLYVRF
jgi:putative membrane protein